MKFSLYLAITLITFLATPKSPQVSIPDTFHMRKVCLFFVLHYFKTDILSGSLPIQMSNKVLENTPPT